MPCERSLWQSNSATPSPPSSFHFTFKLKSEPEADSADTILDCSAPARGLASNTAVPFPGPTRAEGEVSTRHEQHSGRVPAHVCSQHTAEVGAQGHITATVPRNLPVKSSPCL